MSTHKKIKTLRLEQMACPCATSILLVPRFRSGEVVSYQSWDEAIVSEVSEATTVTGHIRLKTGIPGSYVAPISLEGYLNSKGRGFHMLTVGSMKPPFQN
jgi:hypothetical protein